MAKRKITNVKSFVTHIIATCDDMLKRSGRYSGGLFLPPSDLHNLTEIRFIGEAILRKHEEKKTRKDIRL